MIISFLGRNTEGILADARREFGDQPVLVITRDGDQLQPPAGTEAVTVGNFQPEASAEYAVVANGGTTEQLLPIIRKLVEGGVKFVAYNLQRDSGPNVLWRFEGIWTVKIEDKDSISPYAATRGPYSSKEEAQAVAAAREATHRDDVDFTAYAEILSR